MKKYAGRFLLLVTLLSSAVFTMSKITEANPAPCLKTGNNTCEDVDCSIKFGGLCEGVVLGGKGAPQACDCVF